MSIWWCNQSRRWEPEHSAGVVCSSASGNQTFRKTVGEVKTGDIIVHYRQGHGVVAFSRAKENGSYHVALPHLPKGVDYGDGWRFLTEYWVLQKPIAVDDVREKMSTHTCKGYPIRRDGKGKQGYFFRFDLAGLKILVMCAGEPTPAWLLRTADKELEAKRFKLSADYAPTADEHEFRQMVSKLRKKGIIPMPVGHAKPATVRTTGKAYFRDPLVKVWLLQESHGKCEGCGKPAPFTGEDGEPFLESHHVRPLADGGSDKITNAVVLCPNCHRRVHHGVGRKTFTKSLYAKTPRLVKE
jgi:hypothetical protein